MMSILAAIGQSGALDSQQAASQAAHQALDQLGRLPVIAGFIFADFDHSTTEIVKGVSSLLGNLPLYGFTTSAPLTSIGQCERSVVIALLAGTDIQARAAWSPTPVKGKSSDDPTQPLGQILETFHPETTGGLFLAAGDGLSGKSDRMSELLSGLLEQISDLSREQRYLTISGCLSEADVFEGRTYQIGGQQAGSGGVAGLQISGRLAVGTGAAHGWRPVGKYFRITRSSGPWLRSLENLPAAEIYAQMFGHTAREWCFPPLNSMVRLYPLGIEQEESDDESKWLVRSAIRTESDGSLRMNTIAPESGIAHLLVGNESECLEAARSAARQALATYRVNSSVQPSLALIFVDSAWRLLLQSNPGEEARAVAEALGGHIPVVGGYTWGQIGSGLNESGVQILNQHLVILLLGEKTI